MIRHHQIERLLALQDVALDNLNVGIGIELHTELRGHDAVEFDGDDAASAGGQQRGQGAPSGADLENGGLGYIAERFDDAQSGGVTVEKMLSQFRFASRLRDYAFSHVDPLSSRHLDWQSSFS